MMEVARRARVHQTTVSLALRDDPRLPHSTRERIQKIAREMDYRPNPMVSALISERRKGHVPRRGNVLAFLTSARKKDSWGSSQTYVHTFEHMIKHAHARGYGLEDFWLTEPDMTPERMKRILLHRGIRGIVVCPLPGTNHSLDFDFSEFAAVALGYTLRTPALDHVAPDYCSNMSMAIRCLLNSGYQRIVFVTTNVTNERVNHLSVGCYLAERRLHPRKVLAPLVLPHLTGPALLPKLSALRPDVLLISTAAETREIRPFLGNTLPIANLDCYEHHKETQMGVIRSVSEEAAAAVSFVTSRLERAQFGLPSQPQSILITGRWSDGILGPSFTAKR